MRRELTVNGLPVTAEFADEDVEGALVPLLRRVARADAERRSRADGSARTVVLLAAPPGSGKSTLACLLEGLSREAAGCVPVSPVGMDGFHYPNAYLDAHHLGDDPALPTLRSVKGAPETFDVRALASKLDQTRRTFGAVLWPAYSRLAHDVVPDAISVADEVVLVEGNYLLLDEPVWRDLRASADLTVLLSADEGLLRERLVGRKVAGGMARADAEAFYRASDGPNVRRVLTGSLPADLTLELSRAGRLRLA